MNKDLREGIIRIHKEYQKARESQIRRKNKYKSSRTQKHEIRIELCKQLQKTFFPSPLITLGMLMSRRIISTKASPGKKAAFEE
ncbi:MAG: hypothetical protein U5Q03_17990 [Bacteroidota bacterium]|nr:hypothetical protein [Bacteroidota bacterium]